MRCKWCGSSGHESDNCHVLNLTKFLLGESHDKENLPDIVVSMDAEELFNKSEKELHDEVVNIKKLHEVRSSEGSAK